MISMLKRRLPRISSTRLDAVRATIRLLYTCHPRAFLTSSVLVDAIPIVV